MIFKRRKSGFTLMELMVYMAIVGIIVVVAGQAFSNSTRFRVRTQNMLNATQEAENVATQFKADVAQMGAKSSKEAGDDANGAEFGDKFSDIYGKVYMDPDNTVPDLVDHSSFLLSTSGGQSDLSFKRVRYDNNGAYKAVDSIRWFVDNKILYRVCYTVVGEELKDGDGTDAIFLCKAIKNKSEDPKDDAVEIATNINTFEVVAPNPVTASEQQIFPTTGQNFRLIPRTDEDHFYDLSSENEGGEAKGFGTEITLSQFYTNYDNAQDKLKTELNNMNQVIAVNSTDPEGGDWNWKTFCQNRGRISLQKDHTYEIAFEIPFTSMSDKYDVQPFVPGEDHMSVGFRGMTNGGKVVDASGKKMIDDFLFFPPYNSSGSGKRHMRFSVPVDMDTVCLAFTFACYSPKAAQAQLKIKNLTINEVAGVNYDFSTAYNPEAHKNDKKNIKALKLKLQVARGGKAGLVGETGEVEMVIPTPSNGPKD
ncbi:MAG: type II secretion system protein [Fibrobacter sp.]|nr:type II secretion system protein [Fibrobacter sp.]